MKKSPTRKQNHRPSQFYRYDGGDPQQQLTNTEITHTIIQNKGMATIKLQQFKIEADDGILVSMRLEEAFGSPIYLCVSASAYGRL